LLSLAAAGSGVPQVAAGGPCTLGQAWPGYDPDWGEPDAIAGGGETFYMLIEADSSCD